MAGASLNDIKARIKSVEGTMQITKAMELVATSKLRKARENAEKTRPFARVLKEAIASLISVDGIKSHRAFSPSPKERTLYVVIAGDRGLAGGYNANVYKMTESIQDESEAVYLPLGKKALEYYQHRGYEIYSDAYGLLGEVSVSDTLSLSRSLYQGFMSKEYDRVVLVYTEFVSMMTVTPRSIQLLPIDIGEKTAGSPITEEEAEVLADRVIPEYIGGCIFSAVKEAIASETSARRSAMNSANKNAGEMIDTLMLGYNRARQAVITQEITEIISGAEAL